MSLLESHLVYADENYAVFFKPSGMPSAPLHEGDKDNALYYAAEYYPSVLTITSKYKEIEKGLIHRIDTSTSGLILLAGNQNSYNNLIQQQTDNEFVKLYSAYVRKTTESDIFFKEKKGFPFCPYNLSKLPLVIRSSFRKFGQKGKEVRPVVRDTMSYYAKIKSVQHEYDTELLSMTSVGREYDIFRVRCRITKGFRHQVRCHLSWIGLPILGDEVYGVNNEFTAHDKNVPMLFFADSLEFKDPVTQSNVHYSTDSRCFDNIFLTSASK